MARNKNNETSRYDLPCSRILIRSLRYRSRQVSSILGPDPDPVRNEETFLRVTRMMRDLMVVRLLEDRRVVMDHYLCGGQRSRNLEGGETRERLLALNQWAGWDLFDIPSWQDPGPGEELDRFHHELHLSRFWPPGMPAEVLGALWEELLPLPKRTGVYYTPRRIVGLGLSMAMDEPLESGQAAAVRVLDPACGAGYFLLEAYRKLLARELEHYLQKQDLFAPLVKGESGRPLLDPARRMEILRGQIHGVDIDPEALDLARRSLFLEVVSDTPAFIKPAPGFLPLFENLKEGDSILEESLPQQVGLFDAASPPPLKPFIWADEKNGFGRVNAAGGFNCIVGNPPWVSLKGRHKQAPYSPEVVQHLIRRHQADTYRPNIVEFFIRGMIEILAEDGRMSFVAPDRIAENEQYKSLRRFMAERGEILRLHFREPFPGVTADTLIYLFVKKSRPRRSVKILVTDVTGHRQEAPQSYWLREEGCAPSEAIPDLHERILSRIEAAGRRPLSDFLETGVGFIARPNRIGAEKQDESQRPVIKGENVVPYGRRGCSWFEFTLGNLAGGTRSIKKLTHPNRILLRKTGARLVAARDLTGDLPEQSLYFAFPRDRRLAKPYDLRYFLGILNSRLLSFYFRHRKITNRASTPQIKKIHLDSLPIRPINFSDPEAAKLHAELVSVVALREEVLEKEKIRELDRRVDQCVAALYGFGAEEVIFIEGEMSKGWD